MQRRRKLCVAVGKDDEIDDVWAPAQIALNCTLGASGRRGRADPLAEGVDHRLTRALRKSLVPGAEKDDLDIVVPPQALGELVKPQDGVGGGKHAAQGLHDRFVVQEYRAHDLSDGLLVSAPARRPRPDRESRCLQGRSLLEVASFQHRRRWLLTTDSPRWCRERLVHPGRTHSPRHPETRRFGPRRPAQQASPRRASSPICRHRDSDIARPEQAVAFMYDAGHRQAQLASAELDACAIACTHSPRCHHECLGRFGPGIGALFELSDVR